MDRLTQYQKILAENPAMAASARQVCCPPDDPVAVASTCVLGPVLGSFTRWLLANALARGVKRLYFLARDGYLMRQAGETFCQTLGLPVDCRYLYCSRYALRLPNFHRDHGRALADLCRYAAGVTPDRILRRAGLTPEERAAVLPALGVEPHGAIAYARLPEIRQTLAGCPAFLEMMDRHSREALPGLAGYLAQAGLLKDIPYALVDSGWTGSLQSALSCTLAAMGGRRRLDGYYFGLYTLPPEAQREDYHCYYFAPEDGLTQKVRFSNCLFEAAFTAPHGMTLGYRHQNGRYVPRLGPDPDSRIFRHMAGYLRQYIQALAARTQRLDTGVADRQTVAKLLTAFMTRPTPAEAEAFGSLPFSDDVLAGEDRQLAPPLTAAQRRAHHPLGRVLALGRPESGWESPWFAGSLARSGGHTRYHQFQYALLQSLRYGRKIYQARRERRGER